MKYLWILEKDFKGNIYFYRETEEHFKKVCAARNRELEGRPILTGKDFDGECDLSTHPPFITVIHGEEFKL